MPKVGTRWWWASYHKLRRKNIQYSFTKILKISFNDAVNRVTDELKKKALVSYRYWCSNDPSEETWCRFQEIQNFGSVQSTIYIQSPESGEQNRNYAAVQYNRSRNRTKKIKVSAIDPIASMQSVENQELKDIAHQVQAELKRCGASIT